MRRVCCLLLLCAAAAPVAAKAQGVLVAPHGIFIDHRSRNGSFELYNPNSQPAEVSISTVFGYPVTDSTGNFTLKTTEAPDSSQPSAAAWIEAYPRRLVLRPFERQRVRLLARPPVGLPDGEYWSRLVVAATGARIPSAGPDTAPPLRIGLSLEMRTIVAVFYRKGPLRTGVALSGIRAGIEGDSLVVRARLTRQGNAAYLGMLRGKLLDENGKQFATFASQVGVYYDLEPRFAAAVGSLPPARYTLQVDVATDRPDLPRGGPIRATPVRGTAAVTVVRRAP
jgi:P pilus assembly chaperone PapD